MPAKNGRWQALYGEIVLTRPTIEPIYAGARALLAMGIAPGTVVHVRHEGHVVLRKKLGELAQWTS